ncbi:hypothetical protein ABH15_12870 [Methanoculleus taiwanensis]|uniref:PBS lyase n=1 Tax=Methanoculleus taiwanensis TaxID=1550565 RepID=A0A498GZP5_9EURY|nr:HEAT repeat domain-containing protein [Methanoculleus taiwanensis]RXE55116.1 hypothetical protein ABH15_12870 [Methanoculleus taiwanensis]
MERGTEPYRSDRDFTVEKEGIQALQEAMTTDEDERIRRMASIFLGGLPCREAVASLVAGLRDPEKGVRAQAVRSLVAIGAPSMEALSPALRDEDWRVRYRALEALGLIADPAGFDPLVAALGDEKDHVRYMAAKGLGKLRDLRAVPFLIALQSDENEYVRRSVAVSLGAIGGEQAARALSGALDMEPCEGVRDAIAAALLEIGSGSV